MTLNVVDNNTYACPQAAEGTVCWTSHARAAQLLLSAAATATANAMEGAGGGGVHTIYMCPQTTVAICASSYYYIRATIYVRVLMLIDRVSGGGGIDTLVAVCPHTTTLCVSSYSITAGRRAYACRYCTKPTNRYVCVLMLPHTSGVLRLGRCGYCNKGGVQMQILRETKEGAYV